MVGFLPQLCAWQLFVSRSISSYVVMAHALRALAQRPHCAGRDRVALAVWHLWRPRRVRRPDTVPRRLRCHSRPRRGSLFHRGAGGAAEGARPRGQRVCRAPDGRSLRSGKNHFARREQQRNPELSRRVVWRACAVAGAQHREQLRASHGATAVRLRTRHGSGWCRGSWGARRRRTC